MKHNFREAYGVLQRHAQTLRAQTEPNLDDLLTIVTESVSAYKVCQSRIAAVEQALNEALADVQAPVPKAKQEVPKKDAGKMDNNDFDIPF